METLTRNMRYRDTKRKCYLRKKEHYVMMNKKWKEAHPERVRELGRIDLKKYRLKRKNNLAQIKLQMGNKCYHCGYCEDTRILQFHHLRDKNFTICSKAYYANIEKLIEESKKCILLCPNCHAIETLKKFNSL